MDKRDPMTRKQLYITKSQNAAISKLAKRTGITSSEHFRRAIDSYLAEHQKKGAA